MEEQKDEAEDKATEAMMCFFSQFGSPDIYTQIVLEEFFKELMPDDKK